MILIDRMDLMVMEGQGYWGLCVKEEQEKDTRPELYADSSLLKFQGLPSYCIDAEGGGLGLLKDWSGKERKAGVWCHFPHDYCY